MKTEKKRIQEGAEISQARRRLKRHTFFFAFLILSILVILFQRAFSQIEQEAFFQQRTNAEDFLTNLDDQLQDLIQQEEARSITDYVFLNVQSNQKSNFLKLSPLASYPVKGAIPGTMGYFVVTAEGEMESPLLPVNAQNSDEVTRYGISEKEYRDRKQLYSQIRDILQKNKLVLQQKAKQRLKDTVARGRENRGQGFAASSSGLMRNARNKVGNLTSSVADQSESDLIVADAVPEITEEDAQTDSIQAPAPIFAGEQAKVEQQKVSDIKFDDSLYNRSKKSLESAPNMKGLSKLTKKRTIRKETVQVPEQIQALGQDREARNNTAIKIATFDSELTPFQFGPLGDQYFVLYRYATFQGKRSTQGILINRDIFLRQVIANRFYSSSLRSSATITVGFNERVLQSFRPKGSRYSFDFEASDKYEQKGKTADILLGSANLIAPFSNLDLIITASMIPSGSGYITLVVLAWISVAVFLASFFGLYRLGTSQINLAQQQRNFVSAISHELRTPLTSIRMYGEMLRSGMASEDKKKTYYDFIFFESERLSRLISNVLELSKISKASDPIDLETIDIHTAMEKINPQLAAQAQVAGFHWHLIMPENAKELFTRINSDALTQVLINLVDNAIKFSRDSGAEKIEIGVRELKQANEIQIYVRDYGPGVPAEQMRNIFKLFYRAEDELTRKTSGTGIGLALVTELVASMHGKIELTNCEPGAEFRVHLPIVNSD